MNLDITIHVDGKDLNTQELLTIDEANLNDEYATQAARYAYFAVLTAQAEKAWKQAERLRKRVEADAFIEYKSDEELIPKGSRTVSDSLANSYVDSDEEVLSARRDELEAEHQYKLMRAISTAFYQRADMLQSLGAQLRHESDMTGMHVDNPGSDLRRHISGQV
jgi:hypothetical protein